MARLAAQVRQMLNGNCAMFSASILLVMFRDCTLAWGAGFHSDSRSSTKSGIVALAHFHVPRPVVKSAERATGWAWLPAFSATSPSSTAVGEGRFSAFEILKIQSRSHAWMGPDKAPETPDPTPVIRTISLFSQWQDSRSLSDRDAASLRRLTNPLRGFIRRRLARGACRPPSIPPVAAAFECVHACARVGSAP